MGGATTNEWLVSTLNKTPSTSHNAYITELLPGRTYEYIALARGVEGGRCLTWVSSAAQFTTAP
jgi:hypothetical protein